MLAAISEPAPPLLASIHATGPLLATYSTHTAAIARADQSSQRGRVGMMELDRTYSTTGATKKRNSARPIASSPIATIVQSSHRFRNSFSMAASYPPHTKKAASDEATRRGFDVPLLPPRHSRECRNPERGPPIDNGTPRDARWIPAFAGMTDW